MVTLKDKFRGCLLGAAMGDIAGAAVEAESPGYIARTYRSVDEILATPSVPEFAGPDWQVGRYTDDTQMMLCVAEWLLDGPPHKAEALLARFAGAYEPSRRYGPGTELILRLYPEHKSEWRQLATAQFPEGSFGNGSAMRVAPIGLIYFQDLNRVASMARESSRPTHCHPLGYQARCSRASRLQRLSDRRKSYQTYSWGCFGQSWPALLICSRTPPRLPAHWRASRMGWRRVALVRRWPRCWERE